QIEFLIEFIQDFDDFFGGVHQLHQIHILGMDILKTVEQSGFAPLEQAAPKFRTYQNNREFIDFMSLDKRNGFKKFIQSAEAAREDHKSLGVFYKHHLSHKKILKIQIFILVDVGIMMLFKRQVDIESH